MYYVSRLPSGIARIHSAPPTDVQYIEVEKLPEGNGILKVTKNGDLYRMPVPEPQPEPINEMALMKAQIEALSAQNDFLEECIVEMAMEVYSE